MQVRKVMTRAMTRAMTRTMALVVAIGAVGIAHAPASAQWSRTYEQSADRLFNAFDYGHAILYERLYTEPNADSSLLEVKEYDFITRKLLVSPPRLPLDEAAIEVAYAKMAPEAMMMFDWAHLLHRQVYDVLASEDMSQAEKDAKVAELVRYYKTRPDLAFSSRPKNMDLMEQQPYSLAFRQGYPKFNGLIWGYHWLQVGLYEPLMTAMDLNGRQAGVLAAVARFRQMLENAPEHMPRIMPMTAAVAPTFAKRYPEAAIIFDNLHSMHDVVSDILANRKVPKSQKRVEIIRAAERYRDDTSYVMTEKEWMDMAQMMGAQNMGGPAVGILPGWPTPTVARGSTMAEAMKSMQHGGQGTMTNMPGMQHGADSSAKADTAAMGAMPGMSHGADSAAHDMSQTSARRPSPPAAKAVRTSSSKAPVKNAKVTKKPITAKKPTAPSKPKAAPKPPPMDHSKMPGMHNMPGMKP